MMMMTTVGENVTS